MGPSKVGAYRKSPLLPGIRGLNWPIGTEGFAVVAKVHGEECLPNPIGGQIARRCKTVAPSDKRRRSTAYRWGTSL